jgi:death-on-curing protein
MNLPDKTTLLVLHDAQIRRFGGSAGLRDEGLLESAIGRVRNAAAYVDLDPVAAAAMLCHAILKNHAFVDGNKRTAYGALVMTLAGSGLRLEAGDMEIADMIIEAAASHDGHEPIEAWVRERVVVDHTYMALHEHDQGGEVEDPFTSEPDPLCLRKLFPPRSVEFERGPGNQKSDLTAIQAPEALHATRSTELLICTSMWRT